MKDIFQNMENLELINTYGYLIEELKIRNIIRTNNLVGDLGEHFAISHYNKTPELPNLRAVRIGEKGVDAENMDNERYSIKATTTKTTGVFNGLNDLDSELPQEQKFEYVVIVLLNMNLSIKAIYELSWDSFLSLKKWNKSKKTWYLTVTYNLRRKAKILYETESIFAI